jgi:nitrogen fixation protein NifZ
MPVRPRRQRAAMIDPRLPRYRWGQRIIAACDLYNDGSYPGEPPEALLARAGDSGEIVQVGAHAESNTPVYLVDFEHRHAVGCFEEEIVPGVTSP